MSRYAKDYRKSQKLFCDRMERKASKEAQAGISFRQALSKVFKDGKRFSIGR